MSHLATALKTNILLESGTNELEVLIFRIGEQRYGVNVAKVREVLEICPVTQTPTNHHAVEGIIQVRNRAIILLNLERYLKPHLTEMPRNSNDIILLLEFNDELLAFRVSAIERIFRISWNKVEPVPAMETLEAPVTSVIRLGGDLVLMLDFEKIAVVANIGNRANEVDKDFDENLEYVADEERIKKLRNFPLVFADDSPTFRMMLHDELTEAGYTNLTSFTNGQTAWEYLSGLAENETIETIGTKLAAVISDIEMPLLDGLALTKKIRGHQTLHQVPVILFSSIASDANLNKALQVGATEQFTKPKYGQLKKSLDSVFGLIKNDRRSQDS